MLPSPSLDFHLADVGAYTYGTPQQVHHVMKPMRSAMTHGLISAYNMLDKMHVLVLILTVEPSAVALISLHSIRGLPGRLQRP